MKVSGVVTVIILVWVCGHCYYEAAVRGVVTVIVRGGGEGIKSLLHNYRHGLCIPVTCKDYIFIDMTSEMCLVIFMVC